MGKKIKLSSFFPTRHAKLVKAVACFFGVLLLLIIVIKIMLGS